MRPAIGSERLIAPTDGVVAVIITIMVLELKPPHGADLAGVAELGPTLLSFPLSFIDIAIYWSSTFFTMVRAASFSLVLIT